jgi:hypothetical protein
MRRPVLGWIACATFLFSTRLAVAQSTLQTLQQELKDAQQQHQDITAQTLSNFLSQIEQAMGGPDAALALFQQAGGTLPDPSPVVTDHALETASEKSARLALDQGRLTRLGALVQLHCGMMRYAALFVVKPNQKGLQNDWVAWLKSAPPLYLQASLPAATQNTEPTPTPHKRKKIGQDDTLAPAPPPRIKSPEMYVKTMHDSIISKFLGFNAWADSDQGGWSVKDLPKLYRANVLDPLRATPTTDTLAVWDAYISMANADEKDNDNWNQVVYPPLQFERACDDYTIAPSTEKLEGLVNLIKANPTYPQADDWITRVKQFMDDYAAHHGGQVTTAQNSAPTPATSAPAGNSNTTVTTQQQGDMTIVTTRTNSAPTISPH